MSFLSRIADRLGFAPKDSITHALNLHAASARQFKRSFEAGNITRLTADFVPGQVSTDGDLAVRLRLMRLRSRHLFKNEPYAKRFGRLIQKNVVGPAGVQLTVLSKRNDSSPYRLTSEQAEEIQRRWKAWGCSRHVTSDGRMSWRQVQRLAAQTGAVEGETFVRINVSRANPYLISLKFMPADQFDEAHNMNGVTTQIRMCVETEIESGLRVNYWPLAADPGDPFGRRPGPRFRIPAGEMVHWYLPDFVNQSRGIPWLFSTIPQLNMLAAYAEAELVASRVAASKMGFFVPGEGTEYTGTGKDPATGQTITEAAPGTFEELPPGMKFETFDPQHPNANFSEFQKAMLRGVSAGADVSYHTLSGDLEGVNYSSARIGLLDERDTYSLLQDEFISGFCSPIFRTWLVAQATLGLIPLNPAEAETFDEFMWRPRRWTWVDPSKEVDAAAKAVELRIKSRTQICADMGDEFPQTAHELAEEQELLESLDLPDPAAVPDPADPADPVDPAEAADLPSGPAKKRFSRFIVPSRR